MIKFLVSLATVGGVTGAATSISLFSLKNKNQEDVPKPIVSELEQESKLSTPPEEKIEQRSISLQSEPISESIPNTKENLKKTNFEGVLLFNKELYRSEQTIRLGSVYYQAELLSKKEYQTKEEKWNEPDEDSEEEYKEKHIAVDLSSKKTKSEIEIYLKELNKKINTSYDLDKFKKLIEENKEEFIKNLELETYKKLFEKIQELKTPVQK